MSIALSTSARILSVEQVTKRYGKIHFQGIPQNHCIFQVVQRLTARISLLLITYKQVYILPMSRVYFDVTWLVI